ncbi:MAG: proline hydroxylase [Hellea sp.]|nr:proline hydroxylase [Hellea sp.]
MTELNIRLSPDHDIKQLASIYARDNIVRIENLFPHDLADQIHSVLEQFTPWHMVHSDDKGMHQYYSPEDWNARPHQERQQLLNDTLRRAKDGFAYTYLCYPMISAYLEQKDPGWPLHRMTEFLNSEEMLGFVKTITNETGACKIDGQATFYARGHFLNTHDDTGHDAKRRAAYVMGFSKGWRTDWGGHLLFLDDQDIKRGFAPSFNSLTLFKVPRTHIVTQVANFAGAGRYSITGWLHDGP